MKKKIQLSYFARVDGFIAVNPSSAAFMEYELVHKTSSDGIRFYDNEQVFALIQSLDKDIEVSFVK